MRIPVCLRITQRHTGCGSLFLRSSLPSRKGRQRQLFAWLGLGSDRFSIIGVYLAHFLRNTRFNFTTNIMGGHRAMVPIGLYERIMPMDILPTFLLRSMLVGDVEQAEVLGILELDEEDLSLCTFVCPGKADYGPVLRHNLDLIEKEG